MPGVRAPLRRADFCPSSCCWLTQETRLAACAELVLLWQSCGDPLGRTRGVGPGDKAISGSGLVSGLSRLPQLLFCVEGFHDVCGARNSQQQHPNV